MTYALRTRRPKRTMLDEEIAAVLKASGEHREGFRDHVMFSLAIGAGLREHEIAALDLADVSPDGRRVLRTIQLRTFKRSPHADGNDDPSRHRVHLPDATYYKLEKYVRTLPRPLDFARPLFLSERKQRISTRRIRSAWASWQARAGITRRYSFHELRHTAISKFRERTADIRKAQIFARHVDIRTTTIYDHPSDQEIAAAVREQPG
jgi:integrase/recombinase XerC